MREQAPVIEFVGDLSDEGIEALAQLLLSLADQDEVITPPDGSDSGPAVGGNLANCGRIAGPVFNQLRELEISG